MIRTLTCGSRGKGSQSGRRGLRTTHTYHIAIRREKIEHVPIGHVIGYVKDEEVCIWYAKEGREVAEYSDAAPQE
jgi:hypothetical protein